MYAFEINNRIKAGLQLSGYFKRNYIWKATGTEANKASQWEQVRAADTIGFYALQAKQLFGTIL